MQRRSLARRLLPVLMLACLAVDAAGFCLFTMAALVTGAVQVWAEAGITLVIVQMPQVENTVLTALWRRNLALAVGLALAMALGVAGTLPLARAVGMPPGWAG
jgi:hypothetical protein